MAEKPEELLSFFSKSEELLELFHKGKRFTEELLVEKFGFPSGAVRSVMWSVVAR